MNNKRGSTSVFLVFILTSMIFLIAAFIYAAKEISSESYEDGLLGLASRSVLSEFHTELKERYDIFAFESHGMEAERDIRGYMNEACLLYTSRMCIRDRYYFFFAFAKISAIIFLSCIFL